jgi:uncharacterized protein (TIGR00297 family)
LTVVAALLVVGDPALSRIAAGVAAGALFGVAAWQLRFLTARGAWMGGLLALCLIGLGGMAWAGPAFCFFVLSSLLSKLETRRKRRASTLAEKGDRRDTGQVYANGGVGWALLAAHALWPHEAWFWGFVGAFAAATADTWATELGAFSPERPRLITTGRCVPPGTSGGVSLVGTTGALAGALVLGGSLAFFAPARFSGEALAVVAAAGLAGALADSLAGATVQAQFRHPRREYLTERAGPADEHRSLERGWRFVGNDLVNGLCTATGALAAMAGHAAWLAG